MKKGDFNMTDDEGMLIKMIRESADPEKVSRYMISLFSDYLHIHGPSQDISCADPSESA
jgi:hypothetical protein